MNENVLKDKNESLDFEALVFHQRNHMFDKDIG